MRCPNCSYSGAKYKKSRKQYWKGHTHGNIEPRKNFEAYCPKCKHEWKEEE